MELRDTFGEYQCVFVEKWLDVAHHNEYENIVLHNANTLHVFALILIHGDQHL